ncbi:unnamed protein product, partial [Brenthis ino]
MDHLMSKEESYADRRKLFKNIWDTSMHVDEKEDIFSKPKVIKTLRLDEMDRCLVGKKKKQRIKNLRTVCNKLLDFCDRQDADDKFYEQMVAEGKEPPLQTVELRLCKKKTIKAKKKVKKAKIMHPTINATVLANIATSEMRDDLNKASTSISRKA